MLIATAGHVDHGKTSLVRRLTGVDTDRLPQEKARGVSIDLGFAYHRLGGQSIFGFVDVPGHEKFVRNMLAGVGAIDVALLVIAADDGPMPQTREHLAILDLLGIDCGLIALTKIDRVAPERVVEVHQQVAQLIAGTSLSQAEILPVSAQTEVGLPALLEHLHLLSQALPKRATNGRFRLAIDREFTVAGAGLVVTGAVFSGAVSVGDQIGLAPTGQTARVRGLHVQDQHVEGDGVGQLGERCAVNLSSTDLGKRLPRRGDWLVSGPTPEATQRIDATLRILKSEPRAFAHWTPVHIHHGASSLTGRIAVLQGREIAPGESGLVQLVLDQPTVAVRSDRFIVRDQSSRRTVAGGQVIDPFGAGKGRARAQRIEALDAMRLPTPHAALSRLLELEPEGVDLDRFAQAWNLTEQEFDTVLKSVEFVKIEVRSSSRAIASSKWLQLGAMLSDGLEQWHLDHPEQLGLPAADLRRLAAQQASSALIDQRIDQSVRDRHIVRQGLSLRLPSHQPSVTPQDQATWDSIKAHLKPDELQPAVVSNLAKQLNTEKDVLEGILLRATQRGQVIRVAPNRFLHVEAVRSLAAKAEALAEQNNGAFTAKMYRDACGIGRNLAIEVLEYFDSQRFTRRLADTRRIIRTSDQVFGMATPPH